MSLGSGLRKGMLRRSRALIVSPRMWRARLIFWLGALATGVISAGFAKAADLAQAGFGRMTADHVWIALAITPVGMALSALVADRWFSGSQGSGIPQAIAARHLRGDDERLELLSVRMVIGKIVLTVLGLASGASIGREGPTVQVGASVMLLAGRVGGMMHEQGLILAGSAAGIAAAFNTPLAGIVFAIEEMSRSYSARTNGVVLSAVIIAGMASLSITGSYTYFGVSQAVSSLPRDGLLVLVCGIGGGALGAMFSLGTLAMNRAFRRMKWGSRPLRLAVVAGTAGLVVAAVGVASGGLTFGTSYAEARSVVEGQSLPVGFFAGKFVATLASTVSGIPGGLFAPSLAVGAGLGSACAVLLGSSVALGAMLGMAGYFAGVVQAPMTAFVIIIEMTGNQNVVVPVMAAAMLGYGTSRLLAPEPLYHALSRIWMADVLRKRRAHGQSHEVTPAATSP